MPNTELEKAEKHLKYVKEYVKLLKQYDANTDKIEEEINSNGLTKRVNRLNNDRKSIGEALMRVQHEIHCICVESGFAAFEEWRYGDSETGNTMSGFSSQHIHFRTPERYETKV